MQNRHIIKDSRRKIIMDQKSIFGPDIREIMTEIITNSDDSYKRIEKNQNDMTPKKIDIHIDRQKSEITIVDNAEGISKQKMIKIFEEYAGDTSGSNETNDVRGMFGRGATDVLLDSALMEKTNSMISIKDDSAAELQFFFDKTTGDRGFFDRDLSIYELIELRIKYNIEKNGTIVKFGTNKNIPKDIAIKLPDYYMLKFIFASKNRDITIYDSIKAKPEKITKDLTYFNKCETLVKNKIKFKYQNYELDGELEIIHNKNKSDKSTGILIYDEKYAVYANEFFGRERDAGMGEVEGRLKINGLTNMVKYYLNTNEPEQIITPTRDGFDSRHPFYKEIKQKVEGYLIAACSKVANLSSTNTISLKDKKEWKKFFKDINKYFQEELEEVIDGGVDKTDKPPVEGLMFKKKVITIKQEKYYGITLLINPFLIKPGSIINLHTDEKYVELKSNKLIVPEPQNQISSVLVGITGRELTDIQQVLTATSGEYSANLYYEVKNDEIHQPAYGMDFFPDVLRKKPEVERKANIYVDIEKFPIGTTIILENNNQDLYLPETRINITQEHLISNTIAKIEVPISGGILNKTYTIDAYAKARHIELTVKVQLNEEKVEGNSGFINDIKASESSIDYVQSYFKKDERTIIIVSNNIINSKLLSKWLKDKEFSSNYEKHFFYNVVAEELSRIMINQKKEKDKIQLSTSSEELINLLSEEKDKMYKKLLDSMEG